MVKNKKANYGNDISALVVHGIQEKKGNDIVRLDLRNINSAVADYFIICHAESSAQMRAIADSVEKEVYKASGQDPVHKEGFEHCEWILLDYIDIVVHIFRTDKRSFYGIEDLWGDATIKEYQSA
ncbi:ribosome silencing factor [Pseudopedobacter beijingensis]|uniref:Ribosomal silencing factor RsfS n=1 Tax=Pseudopedobacter beijingensis TaxID=1207056 RepID=A0ABW4ICG1_9SPHI